LAKTSPPDETDKTRGALDVATVVPWIAFWGWVALDSALAYRKSQTAQDDLVPTDTEQDIQSSSALEEPGVRRWSPWSAGARAAVISAPIVALLGPLLVNKFMRRRKP
jgi:hypothetical protein